MRCASQLKRSPNADSGSYEFVMWVSQRFVDFNSRICLSEMHSSRNQGRFSRPHCPRISVGRPQESGVVLARIISAPTLTQEEHRCLVNGSEPGGEVEGWV